MPELYFVDEYGNKHRYYKAVMDGLVVDRKGMLRAGVSAADLNKAEAEAKKRRAAYNQEVKNG